MAVPCAENDLADRIATHLVHGHVDIPSDQQGKSGGDHRDRNPAGPAHVVFFLAQSRCHTT